MTFSVNRKALETELSLLQSVAEKKGTIPILSTVLLSMRDGTLTITGTDMDMSLTVQLDATGDAWEGCVPSKPLFELSRLLADEQVEFTPKDDNKRLQLGKGKSKHLLWVFDLASFPAIERVDTITETVDGKALRVAIERGLQCVGSSRDSDSKTWWMQGVAFRSFDGYLHIAGTNSRHFSVSQIQSTVDADVIIPTRAAQALARIIKDDPIDIGFTEGHAVFRQGSRLFFTRLLVAKFPDWRLFVPESFKHSVELDPERARLAFRLVSVTSEEAAMVPIPLTLTVSKDELLLETRETDKGYSAESIAIECPTLNGDSLKAGGNGVHFLGFIQPDTKTILSFNDNLQLYRLSYTDDPNYYYITMALRA